MRSEHCSVNIVDFATASTLVQLVKQTNCSLLLPRSSSLALAFVRCQCHTLLHSTPLARHPRHSLGNRLRIPVLLRGSQRDPTCSRLSRTDQTE
jgi:hypothetical protein